MFNQISTRAFNWIFLIGIVLLLGEALFLGPGFLFSLVFQVLMIYFGRRWYRRLIGKLLFWIGVVMFSLTILNLIAVRFIIIAIAVLLLYKFYQSKSDPEIITPDFSHETEKQGDYLHIRPLMKNRLIGTEKTSESTYAWRDVNILGGIGDRIVDLGNTVVPEDGVIMIQHGIGNLTILVPYEVEVAVHHTVLFGGITVFDQKKGRRFNQQVVYETSGFKTEKPRIRIVTSVWSGECEVKRT
ncbi:cell wall-active antibiotics response protein LiaF [Alteribacter aurantiacus]|uniref:cell wall-active antibiotics response protein LiaF n=1 Tax=Alteribacter aurantiacus TaxID=254410 RepID=UPI0004155A5E|nr:cell wall-active antibiotics response protein LiaF [Alteribacter aurantiacus]